jgi:hypothetical protein
MEAWGLQQVISAGRGDIVDEVIQRDLVGSRAVLACDVVPEISGGRWSICGPVGGSVEVG